MNASQDRRKQEAEKGVADNIAKMKSKVGQPFILCDGCALPILEQTLNKIPDGYKLIDTFIQQVMIQSSKLQIPKSQPELVTFYYPLLEKI